MKALVTGGDQGLGKAIADKLSAVGYSVTILDGKGIKEAVKYNMLKEHIDTELGGVTVDVVVNNFGINHLSKIGETMACDRDVMEINAMLPYWVINKLVANGATCRVLNITSQTYKVAQRTTSLYCASKAALNHMTKVMARELAPSGWIINSFAPGKIEGTDMAELTDKQVLELRGWSKEEADGYATALIPMGRFMDVEEASSIACKILELDNYVNGSTIEAFGGL